MKTLKNLKDLVSNLEGVEATQKVSDFLTGTAEFEKISSYELQLLNLRDEEDREKLRKGIQISIANNIIRELSVNPRWTTIFVDNKSPEAICDEILTLVDSTKKGITLTICGDSGVGKGTLVNHLEQKLPHCIKWSNGDIFRLITYLVCQQIDKKELDETDVSQLDLKKIIELIKINKENRIYITSKNNILYLDDIKNGLLKEHYININLPTVAKFSQGEVVFIANSYLKKNENSIVLVEGRKETLNYLNSDYLFELKMENNEKLGRRRASQKILEILKNQVDGSIDIDTFLQDHYK